MNTMLATLILLACLAAGGHASEGDAAWPFHVCAWRCAQHTGCAEVEGWQQQPVCDTACPAFNRLPVPLALRLARWSCEDDCR